MLHARRTIPLTALMLFAASLARAGHRVWTSSGPGPGIVAVAADAGGAGVVYAASASTVYVSTDGGASWSTGASGLQEITGLVSDPGHALSLFAGTGMGVWHSLDRGDHFAPTGLTTPVHSLAADPTGRVLVSSDGSRNSPLRRSADGGATWSPTVGPRTAGRVAALLFNPVRPTTAYAGLEDDMSYYPSIVAGSIDGGATWATLDSYGGSGVHALASSPDGNTLYAALDGFGAGVGVSRDRGHNFEASSFLLNSYVSSLAVDRVSGRVYAGTNVGVFYSDDGGRDWIQVNDGLTNLQVTSLVVEPTTGRVHAGTPTGVFDLDVGQRSSGPCTEDAAHLCLLGGRFRLSLTARNPRNGVVGPGTANSMGDRFGFFALPEFTGDPAFPEVLVKMVDETALPPGHSFWFFFSGLTDLSYLIDVEDTTTGEVRAYGNNPHDPFCGGADTRIFPAGASNAAATTRRASELPAGEGGSLFLLGGRFEVTLSATDPARHRGSSGAAIAWNDRSGYFSLPDFTGDATFPEIFVKMVDFTSVTGKFWFFYTGLTSLPYTLTVTDHVTGLARTYEGPGEFCGEADTSAFSESGLGDLGGTWSGTSRYPDDPDEGYACRGGDASAEFIQQDGTIRANVSDACGLAAQLAGTLSPSGQISGNLTGSFGSGETWHSFVFGTLEAKSRLVLNVQHLESEDGWSATDFASSWRAEDASGG